MCMSTAYEVRNQEDHFVCEYVKEAKIEGDSVRLTDIMGKEVLVKGTISSIDFVKNVLLIAEPVA